MTAFNIKIISDNVCPFCYLGKAHLDKAISQIRQPSDTFNVSWQAYYLNPDASTKSEPVKQALTRKFGGSVSPTQLEAMQQRIRDMGALHGINFTNEGRVGSTRDSHRVVQLGKTKGGEVENKVVHEIMSMYFEKGGDITKEDDLVAAAEKAGVDGEETRRWLRDGKGKAEVDNEVLEGYKRGVQGVPHFIINDKYELHGAEAVSEFVRKLERARSESS